MYEIFTTIINQLRVAPRWFLPLLALCVSARAESAQTASPTRAVSELRIALVDHAGSLQLAARAFHCALAPDQLTEAAALEPLHAATVRPTEAGLLLNTQFFAADFLFCRARLGALTVNRMPVAGTLQIFRTSGQLFAIESLPLEQYLLGVLAGEMQANWPRESLRAQAVAARSYAVAQFLGRATESRPYDLLASTEDQVYRPGFVPPATIVDAVQSTNGEVLRSDEQVLKVYFHSCCGGQTTSAANVWGARAAPGTTRVTDPYCRRAPHARWELRLSRAELEARLSRAGVITPGVQAIEMEHDADDARTARVRLLTEGGAVTIAANDFRRALGFHELKSTWFDNRRRRDQWIFRGRGFGHGVGLCQWGAKAMAEQGKGYREILEFYYPGGQVERRY
ncbi:MAG: SpoIID/LytB domain-containing protein [Deltaproteobacteria bacterium]|nr:SpoIID/LytB domain-containing protein [Deltaproteobacteria bacterium]